VTDLWFTPRYEFVFNEEEQQVKAVQAGRRNCAVDREDRDGVAEIVAAYKNLIATLA
jgi:hypothetical protein